MAHQSLAEIAEQVRGGRRSAVSVAEEALARIEAGNGRLGAFVALDPERSLAQARAVDELVAEGVDPGPLAGVPLGVKDLEDAVGFPTTQGSPTHADAAPATKDSSLVARLRQAGAVVVGKTNTPPYGWTARSEGLFPVTRNPWNPEHHAGGSSGGSAAAVASGMVPLATASDGGGSIRIPAALCGLPGFKASTGRIPNGGDEGSGWLSLSSKGLLAGSVADTAFALDVVAGPEPSDLRALPAHHGSFAADVADAGLPAVVAWSPNLGYADPDAEVLAACLEAVAAIEAAGVEVVEVEGPFDHDPVAEWMAIVATCLARSTAEDRDHPRYGELHGNLRAMVDLGDRLGAVDLVRAFDQVHRDNLGLVELFRHQRVLLSPTVAATAPPVSCDVDGLVNGQRRVDWVQMTYGFNLTRSPAGTVPVGLSSAGLPIGLQVVGPQHGDAVVLRTMAAIEALVGFDASSASA